MNKLIKKIPLYPKRLVVVITDDFNESGKELKLSFTDRDLDCKALAFNGYYKDHRCVYIFMRPENINSWGIWAHECLHCTNYIMEHVGIPADNDNDEAHAYLLTWMMDEIQKFVDKVK